LPGDLNLKRPFSRVEGGFFAFAVSSGNMLTAFPKGVMKTEFEPRVRRSQRDYSLPFKVAVVGEVGRGELSYKLMLRTDCV